MSGFVFRASNGEWYAVNAQGEQSPSFRTERAATTYLAERDEPELTPTVAAGLLQSLRLEVDQEWINHFGEHVWMGPRLNSEGKRIGITECCFADLPCAHHAALAAAR